MPVLEDEVKGLKKQSSLAAQTEDKILSGKHSTSVNKAGKSKEYRLKLDPEKDHYIYIKIFITAVDKNKSNIGEIALKGKRETAELM